jgi:tRNA-specific 2-thiouridylase
MTQPREVMVAMSGGVDSSVAAALLLDAGHAVTGITLRLWGGETESGCCSVSDVEDARRVAAQLGIPHYVLNLTEEFERAVVGPYVDAYASGRTPNPCVECNRVIKFGALLERARALGFETLATGHHARIVERRDGSLALARGVDRAKDQSYVLYMLGQAELARTLLPIGELTKAEVRAHAARLGLRTADKAESMDVCFVRREDRRRFVRDRSTARAGTVVDTSGVALALHDGIEGFTVGQRRGIGVATGERRYVVDVDAATARVTIGSLDELLTDRVALCDLRWAATPLSASARVQVQTRAHGDVVEARLDGTVLCLEQRARRVAPGQVVALYDDDRLLGGGIAA